jgi:hypothetical protein
MSNSPQCVAYLNAKKEYVQQLNYKLAFNQHLHNDVMQNNFDQIDKSIDNNVIRKWSESSENLKQFFFSGMIDDLGRKDIVNAILHPSSYDTYVRRTFLLIRKYDLPFIRDFLKMELIDRVGDRGFEGLRNSELFNKILEIDGDKFVLHSGVEQFFGKGDRSQHCPLIVSLVRLMTQYHIPYDSRRPEVQKCIQQETEVDLETVSDGDIEVLTYPEDGGFVPVPSNTSLSAALSEAPDWRYTLHPVTKAPLWVHDRSGKMMYEPPPTKVATRKGGGRRTKKCKLSKRMKKRVTRNRKTRKSLRKH